MRFSLFSIVLVIFGSCILTAQTKESIEVSVVEDAVTVINKSVHANCCSVFIIENNIIDYTIYITEIDTSTQKCRCMCFFDLSTKVSNLKMGNYTVNIYRRELKKYGYSYDTLIFIGSQEFTIKPDMAMPPVEFIFKQGECMNPVAVEETIGVGDIICDWALFPNPSDEIVNIRLTMKMKADVELSLFDELGRNLMLIFSGVLSEGEAMFHFNTTKLSSGLYYVKCQTLLTKPEFKKLIIEK